MTLVDNVTSTTTDTTVQPQQRPDASKPSRKQVVNKIRQEARDSGQECSVNRARQVLDTVRKAVEEARSGGAVLPRRGRDGHHPPGGRRHHDRQRRRTCTGHGARDAEPTAPGSERGLHRAQQGPQRRLHPRPAAHRDLARGRRHHLGVRRQEVVAVPPTYYFV